MLSADSNAFPVFSTLNIFWGILMQTTESIDNEEFDVVINDEQQYSIWPCNKEVPAGWKKVGVTGLRVHCLEHISSIWTDMRPLSLRGRTKIS